MEGLKNLTHINHFSVAPESVCPSATRGWWYEEEEEEEKEEEEEEEEEEEVSK